MGKPIMIQGTMSNAGKSLITAGLCRIFAQDGYSVAPFKSQNMALNSYVTQDGLEIGRAQAVQAEAAYQKPSVFMNPILLKPVTDMGSQVIVNGESIGNMSASEYFQYKKKLIPDIKRAYHTLSENNDIIVIEGAGSPAEINLNANDIVNMGLAKITGAPVLLVADIDRGGVFAQLYGTIALLGEKERSLMKGLVINKFRGDRKILEPGLTDFSDRLKGLAEIPFIGVVPYADIDIDDEDSLSTRLEVKREAKAIDIAVMRLPKMSNYTDVAPFERFAAVSVRYVKKCEEFGNPDMIIIPGTKSTISDLIWLRETGLENMIKKCMPQGIPIFGICGGFQMMGQSICDPYGVEYMDVNAVEGRSLKEIRGMELLPIETIFEQQKERLQVRGRLDEIGGIFSALSGYCYCGYEIHMGRSRNGANDCEDKNSIVVSHENNYGTYVHGIFDEKGIVEKIIEQLCVRKGIAADNIIKNDKSKINESVIEYRERQYDMLADILRDALDMKKVYEILEGGI